MILFALGSLLLGILCGYFLFPPEAVPVMDRLMSYALMLLLLSVGIEVGTNKTVFRKIREYNVRILVIPFGVAVGSIAGGLLLGFFLGSLPGGICIFQELFLIFPVALLCVGRQNLIRLRYGKTAVLLGRGAQDDITHDVESRIQGFRLIVPDITHLKSAF